MKVLERTTSVKSVASPAPKSRANSDPAKGRHDPLDFEVGFSISIARDPHGDGLLEHVDVSTIVKSGGPFADRQSVEVSAARQLPAMLREIADELEKEEVVGVLS